MSAETLACEGPFSLRYGDEIISYSVRRRPERREGRIAVHVEPDGRVCVDAPVGAMQQSVHAAVSKRAPWIWRHARGASQRVSPLEGQRFVGGAPVLYLGRRYKLKIEVDAWAVAHCTLRGPNLRVAAPSDSEALIREQVAGWYLERARNVLPQRLAAIVHELPWIERPPTLRVRPMTRRWGSCSPAGVLTINPALMCAPRDCVDYVLLHELCHIKHADHSPAFYARLARHMPGWRGVRTRLHELAIVVPQSARLSP